MTSQLQPINFTLFDLRRTNKKNTNKNKNNAVQIRIIIKSIENIVWFRNTLIQIQSYSRQGKQLYFSTGSWKDQSANLLDFGS